MPKTYRLVSFNLLEGLRPLPASPTDLRQLDRDRLLAARTVVDDLAPDFLVLNEALFCRQFAGQRIDYAALFAYAHQACALYGGAWGNAILSQHPIVCEEEMRIHNRGALLAQIATPDGTLIIASYHPHPRRYPVNKALDFVRLVAGRAGPRILAGDMNCISPEDGPDRAALIEAFRKFSPDPEASVDRFIDSGRVVFGALEAFGLRDAVPAARRGYTIPTDLLDPDKGSAMRIDHILASEEVVVVDGGVAHNPEADRASDHYPVWLDFRLRSAGGGGEGDGPAR
jgi:endonuclease/exonuclease/phosphatase family metal-dependent hydrolase